MEGDDCPRSGAWTGCIPSESIMRGDEVPAGLPDTVVADGAGGTVGFISRVVRGARAAGPAFPSRDG